MDPEIVAALIGPVLTAGLAAMAFMLSGIGGILFLIARRPEGGGLQTA